MKRAIRQHRVDFAAIAALVILAAATVVYVLVHQPAFTFGRSYYTVHARFENAAAVEPGQGEAVTIAGVTVGTVGGVSLSGGQATVTMDIDTRYAPIYRDATVLLQERTPLKDMYLSLDPGSPGAGRVPDGGTLGAGATEPVVDVDQVLGSLDADTRTYLLLLLSGGAGALSGPRTPADLRAVLRRFPPIADATRTFASLLARRSSDLRTAIHDLALVSDSLGGVDQSLASLVRASNTDFAAVSSEDAALSSGLAQLPATLSVTRDALHAVSGFAAQAGPALSALHPFATDLAPALAALRPLAAQTIAPIRNELRPFTSAVTPLARLLEPAAARLRIAAPALASSLGVINTLLDTLAHDPGGTGHSYLYWGSWLAHNLDSVTDTQDANGPIVRGLFMASCPALALLENVLQPSIASLTPLLDLINAPDAATIPSSYCAAARLTSAGPRLRSSSEDVR